MELLFYTDIFLANELKATSLSFSCVFKRRVFVMLSPLLYDACSAPINVIHSIQLGFTIRFALVLFLVAILYQRRWLILWSTISRAAPAARDQLQSRLDINLLLLDIV